MSHTSCLFVPLAGQLALQDRPLSCPLFQDRGLDDSVESLLARSLLNRAVDPSRAPAVHSSRFFLLFEKTEPG